MTAQKLILIVEDNPINRSMLRGILSSEYQILEAENGEKALSVLNTYKDEISLILLDIVMPVMDGYTFLSVIKKDPACSAIPVIVTTQSEGEADEVAALSHGASDFVAKPYKPQVILHRVASIINLRETAAMINLVKYDRLTGLYSKEFFYQQVKDILLRNPGKKFDIICSDIENFKLINDIFGVPSGDRLLCGVASIYKELVKDRGICGRINADQFTCLLERRWQYTDDLFINVSSQINSLTNIKNVVMKWGIYSIEDISISVDQMCDRAMLAARSIKGRYGKYFATYDEELRSKLLWEQAITDGMESALAQGQFEIYLQPKYRIKDDTLVGAEALVRWKHPEWGLQSPAQFIPLFEQNGFITKLDQFVWDKACDILQDWDEKGYPPISISVNVSRADIYNADLADTLTHIVTRHQLPPSRLHLEITESAYTENPSQIIQTVGQLRKLGFVVEMDDFGSGYSSLNMLNQMPLDILKLDMKFIQSETAKPMNQGILQFIMDIARLMNLGVVAEGVETRMQLERLREIGCDYVQGYYFAKPMPCRDFESLIIERHQVVDEESGNQLLPMEEHKEKILLVADADAAYRKQVVETFSDQYQVVEAGDCATALTCVTDCGYKLAAVILSVTLPEQDGFLLLKELQRDRKVWSIPVIATGPLNEHLEAKALKLGADDYACKPHQQSSLLQRVHRTMGITASWEREKMMRDEAYRDYLTGLLNRRGLDYAIDSLRKEDAPLAVYLFDLDNLKQINDIYRHVQGDRLIMQFAALLRTHIRGSDILARFGGDEFIAIIKQMESEEDALKRGQDICNALQANISAISIKAASSAGIALWNMEDPVSTVIERADKALYQAKNENKGNCCMWRGEGR